MSPFVFISWSGAKSKEYALALKKILELVFTFRKDENEIFVSEIGINGSKGWLEEVREKASIAKIIITCITAENKKSPWIHYEVGIGSYMIPPNVSKKIIPILFDMTTKELDGNLTMLSSHQMVNLDNISDSKYYQSLLKKLIYQVDSYLVECYKKNMADVTHLRLHQYRSPEDVTSGCGCNINMYAKNLQRICNFYSNKDFFISRPMMGVDEKKRLSIDDMLKLLVENIKNKQVFYAGKDEVSSDLPTSRLSIIRGCNSFILIYPNVHYSAEIPPSSCLVELGMAIALNKRLHILVELGASVPQFVKLLEERAYTFEKFNNIDSLSNRLQTIINE